MDRHRAPLIQVSMIRVLYQLLLQDLLVITSRKCMVSQKGRQAQTSIYLPVETLERLQQLSKRSRIPMASYLREAVEDLLKKYEEPKKRMTK
jgi:ribbon-helix-helix protein